MHRNRFKLLRQPEIGHSPILFSADFPYRGGGFSADRFPAIHHRGSLYSCGVRFYGRFAEFDWAIHGSFGDEVRESCTGLGDLAIGADFSVFDRDRFLSQPRQFVSMDRHGADHRRDTDSFRKGYPQYFQMFFDRADRIFRFRSDPGFIWSADAALPLL